MARQETGRSDAVSWALGICERTDVLYLDTETTGLGDGDEVLEIAVLDNTGRVLLDTLVKPGCVIPRESIAIHGIDEAKVRYAPSWLEVYPLLTELLLSFRHVVVYNADFDRRLIGQSCSANALTPPQARWHCAMKRYAAFAGERNPRYGGYRWVNLGQAVSRLKINVTPDHRAVSDAQACRAVVHAMASLPTN
ncbi:MAG: 3'-5' exonuclease [Nitrolancea sp.]